MNRKEFVENRLNVISLNIDAEIQTIIQEHILRTESKAALNKIYKQESLKIIKEMRKCPLK